MGPPVSIKHTQVSIILLWVLQFDVDLPHVLGHMAPRWWCCVWRL